MMVVCLAASCRLWAGGLDEVQAARRLLPESTWAEAIEIRNDRPDLRYPSKVPALVFEAEGILWLYTPSEGTQSLSLYRGQTDADKRNLQPLLREIHRDFVSFTVVAPPKRTHYTGTPPYACFVVSLSRLHALAAQGTVLLQAKLLSARGTNIFGEHKGHTVLCYTTPHGSFVYDPATDATIRVASDFHESPMLLAGSLDAFGEARSLDKARYLEISTVGLKHSLPAEAVGVMAEEDGM